MVDYWVWLRAEWLHWLGRPSEKCRSWKEAFLSIDYTEKPPTEGHSHGVAAAVRNGGKVMAQRYARAAGLPLFFYQARAADMGEGVSYSRVPFWPKDLSSPYSPSSPLPRSLLVMIDTDYYVDMNKILVGRTGPTLLVTFVPSALVGAVNGETYRFVDSTHVEMWVTGGATYRHPLWDYNTDCFVAVHRRLGALLSSTVYLVERKQISPDRQVILLVPVVSFGMLGTLLLFTMGGRYLERFRVDCTAGYSRMRVLSSTEKKNPTRDLYLSPVGSWSQVRMEWGEYQGLFESEKATSTGLTKGAVRTTLGSNETEASLVVNVIRAQAQSLGPVVVRLPVAINHYKVLATKGGKPSEVRVPEKAGGIPPVDSGKPGMTAFATPLSTGGFAAEVTESNLAAGVTKRILEPQERVKDLPPLPRKWKKWLKGLWTRLVRKGSVRLWSMEEVEEKMDKPSQKRNLAEAELSRTAPEIRAFGKNEAKAAPKAQRVIASPDSTTKVECSRYTLALSAALKRHPFYAPGKNPLQLAKRVGEICVKAEVGVSCDDFSQMDGSQNKRTEENYREFCFHSFHPKDHRDLKTLLDREEGLPVRGAGVKYTNKRNLPSGVSRTSLMQTITNIECVWICFKLQGKTDDEAWEALGVYMGDDGCTADLDPVRFETVCKAMGFVLKHCFVERGERGVNFLARYYGPFVWGGDLESVCDLKRQLPKLHMTVNLPAGVTPLEKLAEKARSYLLSDRNTPILGEYYSRVEELTEGMDLKRVKKLREWNQYYSDPKVQYPNSYQSWMEREVEVQIPLFDRKLFSEWLSTVTTAEALLTPPVCMALPAEPAPTPVVVNGEYWAEGEMVEPSGGTRPRPDEDGRGGAFLEEALSNVPHAP
jgi:hypothetical protein